MTNCVYVINIFFKLHHQIIAQRRHVLGGREVPVSSWSSFFNVLELLNTTHDDGNHTTPVVLAAMRLAMAVEIAVTVSSSKSHSNAHAVSLRKCVSSRR